jgi:hypothetical protein
MIDMTAYTNLPVFRSSYDLMIEVFNLCGSLPKDDRHTLGERLKNTCMDFLEGEKKLALRAGVKEVISEGEKEFFRRREEVSASRRS